MIKNLINKFKNLSIFYKIFIIFIILILLLIISGLLFKKTPSQVLRDYIVNEGYTNDDGGSLYYKQLSSLSLDEYNNNIENNIDSEYILSYVDIDSYEVKLNYREYIDNVNSVLNLNYELVNDKISFKYRVVLDDMSSAVFSGEYYIDVLDNFVCNKEYTNNLNADDNNSVICNKIKDDIVNFQSDSLNIIPSDFLDLIR